MAAKYLGEEFDIHGGGSDLIFPHHENEIAQSEGATGKPFAHYWLHNGMVNLGGEKMSKSTGVLVDLGEAIRRFGGMAIRLLYLRAHYRSPIEFREELAADAAAAFALISAFYEIAEVLGLLTAGTGIDDLAVPLQQLAAEFGAGDGDVPEAVLAALLERRRVARQQRDWAVADAIRARLEDLGIMVEDSADGTRWHRR